MSIETEMLKETGRVQTIVQNLIHLAEEAILDGKMDLAITLNKTANSLNNAITPALVFELNKQEEAA